MDELYTEIKQMIISSLDLEDISAGDIETDAPLFGDGLGLDSIDALELGVALQRQYGITLASDSEDTKRHFASVKALAERYGIHRATVFAHLRRRNVPSRRPGLGIDEKAEAVRLARAGVSMRAIGRRMGVDRKAVRAALVEAGLIVDGTDDSRLD